MVSGAMDARFLGHDEGEGGQACPKITCGRGRQPPLSTPWTSSSKRRHAAAADQTAEEGPCGRAGGRHPAELFIRSAAYERDRASEAGAAQPADLVPAAGHAGGEGVDPPRGHPPAPPARPPRTPAPPATC